MGAAALVKAEARIKELEAAFQQLRSEHAVVCEVSSNRAAVLARAERERDELQRDALLQTRNRTLKERAEKAERERDEALVRLAETKQCCGHCGRAMEAEAQVQEFRGALTDLIVSVQRMAERLDKEPGNQIVVALWMSKGNVAKALLARIHEK